MGFIKINFYKISDKKGFRVSKRKNPRERKKEKSFFKIPFSVHVLKERI